MSDQLFIQQYFSRLPKIFAETKSDRIQILIPAKVQGKESEILTKMRSVVASIEKYLPENWIVVSYGACSPRYQSAIHGEGIDIVLHRQHSMGYTIDRFCVMPDFSLAKIN